MQGAAIDTIKADLRRTALAQRSVAALAAGESAAERVAEFFISTTRLGPDEVVAGYWPIRDEFDCRPLLTRLLDAGQPVCLPVTEGEGPLVMRRWRKGEPLYPSGFGTFAPAETAPEVAPDVVLLPLLGFDAKGNRLGYGKGHYDRTLTAMPRLPLLVGLAYAGQQMAAVPRAPHDVALDMVITEAGVMRFGEGPVR